MKESTSLSTPSKKYFHPVIIIGMHRSGTSLLTKFLGEMGLFIGKDLERNYESIFFQRRNEAILNANNSSWDNPAPAAEVWFNPQTRQKYSANLRRDLGSFQFAMYLGTVRFLRYRSAFKLDFPWCWKDPRNTILLPLWLEIFPAAKIIHVVRNGIDVAKSLSLRENSEQKTNHTEGSKPGKNIAKSPRQKPRGETYLRLFEARDQILGRNRDRKKPNSVSHSVEDDFNLWKTYEELARKWTECLAQNSLLHINYERFLMDPTDHLRQLCNFCDLDESRAPIAGLAKQISVDRAYAFRNSSELVELYQRVKNDPIMRANGYDKINLDWETGYK